MKKINVMVAAVIATGAMLAQGEQISFDGTATTASPDGVPSTVSVNVQQFNASLGTLTGVTLSLVVGEQDATFRLSNTGSAGTWTVGLLNGRVRFSDGTDTATSYLTYSEDFAVAAGSPSVRVDNRTIGMGASQQNVGAISKYVGTGYVSDMTVAFNGFFYAEGPGGGDAFTVDSYTGTAVWKVTYTYNAVPEPTSLALLAVGCAALGLRRRARFSKKA